MLAKLNQSLKIAEKLTYENGEALLAIAMRLYLAEHCVASTNMNKVLGDVLKKIHPDKLGGDIAELDVDVRALVTFFAKGDLEAARDGLFKLVDENKKLHKSALELIEALAKAINEQPRESEAQKTALNNMLKTIVNNHFKRITGQKRDLLYAQVNLVLDKSVGAQNPAAIALIQYQGKLDTTKRWFSDLQHEDARARIYILAYANNMRGFIAIENNNFFNPFIAKVDPVEFFKDRKQGDFGINEIVAVYKAFEEKNLRESRWLNTPITTVEKGIVAILSLLKIPGNVVTAVVSLLCVSIPTLLGDLILQQILVRTWSSDIINDFSYEYSLNPVKDQFARFWKVVKCTFQRSIAAPGAPWYRKLLGLVGHLALDIVALLVGFIFLIAKLAQGLAIFVAGLNDAIVDYGARLPFVLPRTYLAVFGDCKRGLKNAWSFIQKQVQRVGAWIKGEPEPADPRENHQQEHEYEQENRGEAVPMLLLMPTLKEAPSGATKVVPAKDKEPSAEVTQKNKM